MGFNVNPGVQNHMGEFLAQGIRDAFAQIAEGRRRRREESLQDQARSDRRTMIEAQNPGLHLTDRGVFDIPQSVWDQTGKSVSDAVDRGGSAPAAPTTGGSQFEQIFSRALAPQTTQGPRFEFGHNFYRDNAEADADADRKQGRALRGDFQKTMLGVLASELTPKPQEHVTDRNGNIVFYDPRNPPLGLQGEKKAPLPGTPEWRQAEIDKAKIQRQYGPAPTQFSFGSGLDENGQPVVLRQNVKTGDVTPTEVAKPAQGAGGKGSRPTEAQMRANLVFPRAEQAAKDLEEFYREGAPGKTMIARAPGVGGMLGNYALSEREQRMVQAAETAASAILRLESGAAVTDSEVKSYAKQFLPEPGDGPEVRAQKRRALHMQLEAMRGMTTTQLAPQHGAGMTATGGPPGDINLSAGKVPNSAQKARAAKDPEYKEFLTDQGYKF